MDLLGLFVWSFLAATILPLGSEPALAAVVSRRELLWLPVVVATAGNYLGACTTYLMARLVADRASRFADGESRIADGAWRMAHRESQEAGRESSAVDRGEPTGEAPGVAPPLVSVSGARQVPQSRADAPAAIRNAPTAMRDTPAAMRDAPAASRDHARLERAARVVRRYGAPALLLSWVPILGDAIVAAAGAVRMPFGAFTIWTLLGKFGRYAAISWVVLRVSA